MSRQASALEAALGPSKHHDVIAAIECRQTLLMLQSPPLAIEQIEVEIEWLGLAPKKEKAAALDGAAAV
ncbi:hypothetical protein AUC71_11580 [Methyloceanibacter marginalis]|jgi:hypothetical protein|uniref:Uncharacterized protein n=1 Tax=Methyloceanibacter marginalis TaxID=1774971 RepID=A0A1E3WBA1_9HYPH|nr:hypothetical protein [Methyloceanibacter marginalis]ODS03093.1 hypothetical protein AUC71_11580 [Methyloceanibacter marginalis]